ncbi:MAG: phosphate ABC transporter permease [Actinobacteria bacterium RBG_13_63_9]|nr:MAG: phosphate ABC transporter permease [Actinobacteria bacterium RBG_13_63_9]
MSSVSDIVAPRAWERSRAEAARQAPGVLIKPTRGWALPNVAELWQNRELLYFLIWRDIKVRYKQTAVGAAWAVIQPLLMMAVFTLFFGRVAGISSGDVPYPIFTYSALLPWQLFALGLTLASTSLVVNERLITKVYFPRILVPSAAVLAGLVDFGIAFLLLIGMMPYFGIVPSPAVLTLPLFLLLAVLTALGLSYWLSALDVQYRDVRYTIPFLIQIWLLATPVFYPSDLISERWQVLLALNPMAGVVEGFRWALLGQGGTPDPMVAISAFVAVVVFVGGVLYFRRVERFMADVV